MKQIPSLWNAKVGELALKNRRRRAFNLVELLVVMLLIGLMATVSISNLMKTLPRQKLRTKAQEVSGFFQKARLSAIRAGFDVSVEIEDLENSEQALIAYRQTLNGTRLELGRVMVGTPIRPFDPYLAGAAGASAEGAKFNTFQNEPSANHITVVYKPTGNATKVGALRVSIGQGTSMNTIEVAVTSLGGQPVLRKYTLLADRPTGNVDKEYLKETHYGTDWKWVWY